MKLEHILPAILFHTVCKAELGNDVPGPAPSESPGLSPGQIMGIIAGCVFILAICMKALAACYSRNHGSNVFHSRAITINNQTPDLENPFTLSNN